MFDLLFLTQSVNLFSMKVKIGLKEISGSYVKAAVRNKQYVFYNLSTN